VQIDPKAESLSHEIQTLQEEVEARLQLATMIVSTAPDSARQSRSGDMAGTSMSPAAAVQSRTPESLHELQAAVSTMQVCTPVTEKLVCPGG
jgi:hypothetical protein